MRGCEGVFIIALNERSSTSPRKRKGNIPGILIVIGGTDIVPISPQREEGWELGLEQVLERGIFKVCRALKWNAR